jgi:hypothetical protein
MPFQRVTYERPPAAARFDVWPFHTTDRRSKSELSESGQDLNIILETALPQRTPGNFAGGILADELLSFALGHGHSIFRAAHYASFDRTNSRTTYGVT